MPTKIPWTDKSWNPIVGCSKISPGCQNCYAEKMAHRLRHICLSTNRCPQYLGKTDDDGHWTGQTELVLPEIKKPFHWKKPRMIFVCSMGDLFHESVKDDWLNRIFSSVIEICPQHTFQILTKRPERMKEYLSWRWDGGRIPAKNCWIGVTAENQEMADTRIPILLQIPAAKRFVSIEPMLMGIDILQYLPHPHYYRYPSFIDWVIIGAESGPNRRPCSNDWVSSLVDQCENAKVPCFVKQIHGENGKLIKMPSGFPQEYPK